MRKNRSAEIISALAVAGILPLFLSGCSLLANKADYGRPLTHELDLWRQYLGVTIAVQYLLLTLALWKAHKRGKLSRLFLSLLLLPLVWTILGEWTYRLGMWIIGWGQAGEALAAGLSFISGLAGGGSIYPYLIGAFVFNDSTFLLYWAVPSVAASYAAAIYYLSGFRLRKKDRLIPPQKNESRWINGSH